MSDIFLARQPIFDQKMSVVGYELLYRHGSVEHALVDDDEVASARVAVNALTELGLHSLVGPRRAWINVTREFLLQGLAYSLPPGRVVLELLEGQLVDEPLLEVLADVRAAGYQLALDDFRYEPALRELLVLADIVKLDLIALGPKQLLRDAQMLRTLGLSIVAEKLETHEDFKVGIAAGCELFQGYFFCRPQLLSDRAVAPNRLAMLQLASALQDPAIELTELDRLISTDVALSYRLLRYINSAYFSLRHQVGSIVRAVALLGIENVRRWATLTIFAAIGDKPRELFLTALIRGRFCETAGDEHDGPAAERFTLGMFSVLDALTDAPMRTIVDSLPFPDHIHDALVDHTGAGHLLDCVEAIERGDFDQATELDEPATRYLESVTWAEDKAKHLFCTS
jgi:c-di-GMP phosphodiesterase